MKEFKGTPGPWRWHGSVLVNKDFIVGGDSKSFSDSNKNLIAAAPDLLEALQWAMNRIGGYTHRTNTNGDFCDAVDRARAAISKALGE